MSKIEEKKMLRFKLHVLYWGIGLLAFFAATNGCETLASMVLAQKSFVIAAQESVRYTITQPMGALFLALPFFVVSGLSAELARAFSMQRGFLFFFVAFVCIAYLYCTAYWDAQHALLEGRWTASTLLIGLLPFKSIPVLIVAGLAVGVMFWKIKKSSP